MLTRVRSAIATKRGTELLQQGRVQARRAMGAPDPGAVGSAFIVGVALGAAIGALVAMLMTPMPGREARQRLTQQAEQMREQMRERMPEMRVGENGRHGPVLRALAHPGKDVEVEEVHEAED